MKTGILGGGLTGLTIAYHLKSNFELLEKENECGGLCRSLEENGFTFDYGGAHIIFSRNREPIDFMVKILGGNCLKGKRNNKILLRNTIIKYPFENGLSSLAPDDRYECLYHYLKNDYPKPRNFKEWIYYTFGKGIAEKYLIPYNEKIWNYDTKKMSLHWVEGRVPKPPVEDVIKSAVGVETEGYTHQLYFYYPKKGGIQSLIRALEYKINGITTVFEVKSIRKQHNKWIVSDGRTEKEFDRIVSTLPIFDLAKAIGKIPANEQKALNGLKYNSLITVMLGIRKPGINAFTALYSPDKDFLPNRIGFPANFSKYNAPAGKSSLVAEITANKGDGIYEQSDAQLIRHVTEGLHKRRIINKNKVSYSKVIRSKYAYVVYDLNYLKNIRIIRNYISGLGIELCGRFAEFEYLNMDTCITRGQNMAKKLNTK